MVLQKWRRNDACGFTEGKSLYAEQIIHDIGNYFCVRLKGAFIAEHFDKAAVSVIRGDFTVMYDGIIQ